MKTKFKIPTGTRESRIKQNVAHRQALKKKWDRHCKYEAIEGEMLHSGFSAIEQYNASQNDNYVRLLDEGVVVDGSGWAYAVIAKGVLKAWYDNLSTNFKGKINKDHCDAIDLGTFSKKDLKLVELGNDRYGIDVNVKLDDELYAVKDLKRMMNRKALSSEFYWDAEQYITAEAATGDEKQGKWLIPVINEIKIDAYAVVDNPKNANSYSDTLLEKASNNSSEGDEMTDEEKKRLEAEKAAAEAEAKAAAEGSTEDQADETDGDGDGKGTDEGADQTNANADEGDKPEEGGSESEGADGENKGEDEEKGDGEEFSIPKLKAAFEALKADNAAKDEEIARLKAEIANSKAKEDKYMADLTDLFKFASSDEPAEGEAAKTTTPEEDTKDAYESALEAAFKEMEG